MARARRARGGGDARGRCVSRVRVVARAAGDRARGATAYVTNSNSGTVTPIDVATGALGTPITVGGYPYGIAITPDGATAYVTDLIGNIVTPIDLTTHTAEPAIHGVSDDMTIIVTPDGSTAYVATGQNDTVTPIDLTTRTAGAPIAVTGHPFSLGISTYGKTIYAALASDAAVTPIDVVTQTAGTPIALPGTTPVTFANAPDGKTIYVVGSLLTWGLVDAIAWPLVLIVGIACALAALAARAAVMDAVRADIRTGRTA